jgi:hypothetical protein
MWSLRQVSPSQVEVARRLGITPQSVNKALGTIDSKVSKALLDIAQANRISIRKLDPAMGYLIGKSQPLDVDTLVTFSPVNGMQVWYRHEQGCDNCGEAENCRRLLLSESSYRGIGLTDDEKNRRPSELADALFRKMLGEDKLE